MKTDKNAEMDDAESDETSGLSNEIDTDDDSDMLDSDGDILLQFSAQALSPCKSRFLCFDNRKHRGLARNFAAVFLAYSEITVTDN